jgi:hypothetical protein
MRIEPLSLRNGAMLYVRTSSGPLGQRRAGLAGRIL